MEDNKPLTSKQEGFAQIVTSGNTLSDAYRQAYDTMPDVSMVTVNANASKLAANPKVGARIQELRKVTETALAEKRAWDLNRVVEEAETNLKGSRTSRQWGSANGALEYIGRATGLVTDKPMNPQQVHITRVTVVLSDVDTEGQQRVVESTSRELPRRGDEDGESTH